MLPCSSAPKKMKLCEGGPLMPLFQPPPPLERGSLGRMDWSKEWMDSWMDWSIDRWLDAWMDGWMDGKKDGWLATCQV